MTHVTFGDPSAWENPPNPGHGCEFSVGDFESTCPRTRPTHTRVPAWVCKPVMGPIHLQGQLYINSCLNNISRLKSSLLKSKVQPADDSGNSMKHCTQRNACLMLMHSLLPGSQDACLRHLSPYQKLWV